MEAIGRKWTWKEVGLRKDTSRVSPTPSHEETHLSLKTYLHFDSPLMSV